MTCDQMIDKLAKVILDEFGGPLLDEDAVDASIRVMRSLKDGYAELECTGNENERYVRTEERKRAAEIVRRKGVWCCEFEPGWATVFKALADEIEAGPGMK